MWPFGKKSKVPKLDRRQALDARPVLDSRVRIERDGQTGATLQVPRRATATNRLVCRVFKLSSYHQITLDELGAFVIELCDGERTVRQIAKRLAGAYKLGRREAELSTAKFFRKLVRRSIVVLIIEDAAS